MSKEIEDRVISSNVVAKLMGLETASPLSRKGKYFDKQLDLVRRMFVEAKRLVTDEKLHGSDEFQEALQVLCSNKDLLVKLFPHHPEANRITVLRPSKAIDAHICVLKDRRSKQIKKSPSCVVETTRIVFLKPSPGKALDVNAIAYSSSSPSCFDEAGEMAKDITHQIRRWHCRNKTLSCSSSVLSNGYINDDDGLLNRFDNQYQVGNISNSEIMSPFSRRSWDCADRLESPFSSSSFSRASLSPKRSVLKEAKKRLSERWAMMSLNEDTQQHFPKVSTVLGDMLALSEMNVQTRVNEVSSKAKQGTRRSVSCIGSGLCQVESTSGSLNTLERSKSVPEIRLSGRTSVSGTSARELTKSRSLKKSSWKVSSLFFFRNKKANKEKTDSPSQLTIIPSDAQQQQQSIAPTEDQPRPVSVLQSSLKEDCSVSTELWTTQGEEMSLKSNLIDKSPPIGSIPRVFSWEDESHIDITKPGIGLLEDEDWYNFIKTVLKASGFSGSDPLLTLWHSPDCPMDPSLSDKFSNKEPIKRRKQRSNRKLVFDCVNNIITEITSSKAESSGLTEGFDLVEHVWTEFKNCLVKDTNNFEGEESVVKEEVVGKTWSYNLQVEMKNLGVEIEVVLLQELVEEAVFDCNL
ncbi:unnamed protein product [Cochlearia groenlandica]